MQRTLEPELMTDTNQVEAYAAADFKASDAAFVALFLERFGDDTKGPIIDLGCGPGNITFRLAEALPGREILGVDGSATMLALAEQRLSKDHRIRFIEAYLPSDALAPQTYAAVVSNSLLHHLPDPKVLWQTIAHIAAPGAPVLIGDLGRPETSNHAQALVDLHTTGEPDILRHDFRASLHAAFTATEVRDQIKAAGLTLEVRENNECYLLISGRR